MINDFDMKMYDLEMNMYESNIKLHDFDMICMPLI